MSDSVPATPATVGVAPPANLTGAPPGSATGQHPADPPPTCQAQAGAAKASGPPPASPPGAGPTAIAYVKADPAQLANLPETI